MPDDFEFPPMKIGGPIEAAQQFVHRVHGLVFPPMKIGGPIEAVPAAVALWVSVEFPPMKIGGPIEAATPTRFSRTPR